MPTFKANDGVCYYFETYGAGSPLVLLHGFTGCHQNWNPHINVLATQFLVIVIDILGHGRSDSPPDESRYHMETVGADIISVLEGLVNEPVHLLGYSMGGRLALYLAVTYPERMRTLILESASPGLATAVERQARIERDRELADWIEQYGMEAFVNRWEQLPLWASQQHVPVAKRQALRQQRLQNNPVGLANSLRGMGTGVQPSLWSSVKRINLPILVLAGALDPKFVAIGRQLSAQMKDAQLKIIPDAGHTIHLERPSRFQHLVVSFLKEKTE
jgi:2-succinyl-6-hydroxy-2,4-cyclohexadiene-1-carboxylate synthase